MHVTKRIDVPLLQQELDAAGVIVNGLQIVGSDTDADLWTFGPVDEHGSVATIDLPPEAQPVVDAHDATKQERTAAFESAEDAERLRVINERARTDPAYAALADFVLRGVQT